ncbi:MAG: KEOPS complex kinase/ATPase Bud32, partial [Candidatus Micrarchaeia archaeon]
MSGFFARGAEAKLYESTLAGMDILVKDRSPKAYRVKELDEKLREARTRKEARILLKAAAIGVKVPQILSAGRFSLHIEKLHGKRLREARMHKAEEKKIFRGAGKVLAMMHGAGITHGDFTPANIMLCKDGIYIIDFGLAEFSDETEEMAVDILLMEKSIPKEKFSWFL